GVRPADAATGAFDLGRAAPGTYEVRATAAGFADASVLVGVDEPPGAVSDPAVRVDLRLRRGVALAGRVVDRFGEPVADADVEAARAGSRLAPRRARTGPDGRFEIGGLDPGRYRVEASHEDLGTATTDATLDVGALGRPVELAFARAVPARVSPEGAADRIAYSVVNDAVIVSRPADVLLAGDVIVQVGRERIRDIETLRAVLSRVRRATVSVAVERSGRRRFLAVDREAMLAQGW
ncbi:MAG: carboxypeptidase regulatory-like domain-containing protein, partial [Myxococcota bacterium]|nr:carboxypeptidase regulatory-like domain-containing protein [Myxococcota bacterium]